MDWKVFLFGSIGVTLVIEGIIYSLFSDKAKVMFKQISETSEAQLRIWGVTMVLIGLVILTIFKQWI